MSECSLMKIPDLVGFNYGEAVMDGLRFRVIRGYEV